jgi:hypothetical protein
VLDLNGIMADIEKMLGRLIGEDVHLVTKLGKDLGRVQADRFRTSSSRSSRRRAAHS